MAMISIFTLTKGRRMATKTDVTSGARNETPRRIRKAKSDAALSSIQSTMEKTFDLPIGSIRLFYPSGRKARTDSTVGALRDHWLRFNNQLTAE